MTLNELLPGIRRAVWSWLDAFFLEDAADGLPVDLPDSELPQFTNDPRISKPGRLRDIDDQFANFARLPLPALWALCRRTVLLITHPAIERRRGNDRDQFFDCPPECLPKLQQTGSLSGFRVNLSRNTSPQNPVLFFQVLDIFRQLGFGRGGDQGEKRVENPGGHAIVAISNLDGDYTFVEHRCVPRERDNSSAKLSQFKVAVSRQVAVVSER